MTTLALVILALVIGFVAGVFSLPTIQRRVREHEERELPPDA